MWGNVFSHNAKKNSNIWEMIFFYVKVERADKLRYRISAVKNVVNSTYIC